MTKTITIILLMLSLSGCSFLDKAAKILAGTPTNDPFLSAPVEQVELATPELPEIEMTPTLVFTPSPDTFQTQMAAEKANNEQQLLIVNKRLEAAATESANIAENKTQTTRKETHEAGMVIATGTQLAMVGTNDQAARDFRRELPTIIYRGTQAMYAGPIAQSEIAFNLLAGGAFIVIAFIVVLARIGAVKRPASDQQTQQQTSVEKKKVMPPAVSKTMPFAPVERTGEYLSPPGNHSHFLIFLMAIFSGKKGFSKPEWEGADSPYNRQTYSVVYNWLFAHKFIELPPGGKLRFTTDGEGWAVGWMDRNYLLSPEEDDPTYLKLSSENSQAPEIQGPEKAGGVVGEVVEPDEDEMEPA